MDLEAPVGQKRWGFRPWKWLILAVIAMPLLAFFVSNVMLATPWVLRWMGGRIQARVGLETHISSVSWSPWNGISLHNVLLLQPPPLRPAVNIPFATIDKIQISLVWSALLQGKGDIRSISLESPKFTLPIELLSSLSMPSGPSAPAAIQTPSPGISPPTPMPTPPPTVAAAPPATTQNPPAAQAPPPMPLHVLPPRPTGWLRLKNASFSLVSAARPTALVEVSDITGSLPIDGDPAKSRINISELSIDGNSLVKNLQGELAWKFPVLSLQPIDLNYGDVKFRFATKIGMLNGLPLQVEAQIPPQPLPKTGLPMKAEVKAEGMQSNFGFRGLLLAPGTWQADLVTEVTAATLDFAGHSATFDRGQAVTTLRGGILSCVDARLISDELSFLGNATVLANGNLAGALRVVAQPGNLESMVTRTFPDIGKPKLTPLATPQRACFDVQAFGNIGKIYLQLGADGPISALAPSPANPH